MTKQRRAGAVLAPVIIVLLVLAAERLGLVTLPTGAPTAPQPAGMTTGARAADSAVSAAFRERRSDAWVEDGGEVIKLLADDRDGVPHQKFLVRIDGADGLTVLIAHNLDAAERVPVRAGDRVRFRGEYEWTEKGGTVHFTHAPELARRDPGGWIEFGGRRYE